MIRLSIDSKIIHIMILSAFYIVKLPRKFFLSRAPPSVFYANEHLSLRKIRVTSIPHVHQISEIVALRYTLYLPCTMYKYTTFRDTLIRRVPNLIKNHRRKLVLNVTCCAFNALQAVCFLSRASFENNRNPVCRMYYNTS